ncbi:PCC domain-containing protein [Pseudochelatococcus sp. B33]
MDSATDSATHTMAGTIDSVVYVRLGPQADLYKELKRACVENDIKTGVVMTITGGLERARLQLLTTGKVKTGTPEIVEFEGPFEASGHGLIGRMAQGDSGGIFAGEEAGSPYIHVHLTVTVGSGDQTRTVCGHLMEGCTVRSNHPISHFTVVLAKVGGMHLNLVADKSHSRPGYKDGLRYHTLTPA